MKQKLGLVFLYYIRILAKLQLAKINLLRKILGKPKVKIIGITGSAGKTSTMLAIVASLKNSFKIKYTRKANSESGIPLDILGLQMSNYGLIAWFKIAFLAIYKLVADFQDYDVYVVEMGIDEPIEPKNMSYLLKIIQPDIGVFTSVTSVHAMQFPGSNPKQKIAKEKAKLIQSLPKTGTAVLNYDDNLVRKYSKTKAGIIRIGKNKNNEIVLENYGVNLKNTKFEYQISADRDSRSYSFILGYVLPGVYAINFGLVLGVAKALKVPIKKAIKNLQNNFKLPPGRSNVIPGIKDTIIIDSSYNSSPKALKTMLLLLKRFGKKTGRKTLAVIGDMRELGNESEKEHKKLAKIAEKCADKIVTVGPETRKYFGMRNFLAAGKAARYLKKNLQREEIVLIKGSQNTIFLEIIVNALMKDKSQAAKLLCRRGAYWQKQRAKFR